MKRVAMIISLACVATFCYAQPAGQERPQPPSAEEMIAKATNELSLTDKQVNQWKE